MSCSYEDCDFECYESNDMCIFHYDKKDWLTPDRGDWKSDADEKIKYFWREIRRLKGEINKQFIGFIFPRFEEYKCDLISNNIIYYARYNYGCIDNTNFGLRCGGHGGYHSCFNSSYIFKGVVFLDDVDFSKVKLDGEIIFENIIFVKNILFSFNRLYNITFNNVQFKQDMNFDNYKIDNCKFINTIFENKITFVDSSFSSANFEDSTFKNEVSFENINMSGVSNFKNTTFKEEANFENGSFSDVDFTESTFEKDALFTGREIKSNAEFSAITVKGKANFDVNNIGGVANFSDSTFEKEVTFKDVEILGEADFRKCKSKSSINFNSCKFYKSVYFNNAEVDDIDFSDTKFFHDDNDESNYDLEFKNGKYGIVNFSNSFIGQDLTAKESSFKSIKFNNFNLTQWGSIEFRNLKIDDFIFNKYVNESEKVLFDFVTVNNKLEIKDVSFDEERFNHFNLLKAEVEIENSAFNDNFFNSVKWGTISERRYTASRDIFRQLKFYSEQQKNFIDADGFYSLEMKERKKELREESKDLTTWSDKIEYLSQTMVFYMHEKTSDFSQNWMLPIYWLLILGMGDVIYGNLKTLNIGESIPYLLLITIGLVFISPIYKSIFEVEKLPKWFFYLCLSIPIIYLYLEVSTDYLDDIAMKINPSNIFKSTTPNENDVKEVSEFGHLLFRIAVLFLVYQVIVAMKKKVRSK